MFQRNLPWVAWALLALVIVSGLGFWYLSSQRLQLDEENRRELARVAHNLESILSALSTSATNYFKEGSQRELEPKQPSLSGFVLRNPYILTDQEPREPGLSKPVCAGMSTPLTLTLMDPFGASTSLAVDTAKIFDEMVIGDAFEYLFIASQSGEVIVGRAHGTAHGHRENLSWLGLKAREEFDQSHPLLSLKNLQGFVSDDKQGKPIDPGLLVKASESYAVRLSGTQYQLFSYPFTIPEEPTFPKEPSRYPSLNDAAAPKSQVGSDCPEAKGRAWIVGGLVNPAQTWRSAAALSPRATLELVVILLLAIASQPFLKLYLVRRTERFRFADGCMMPLNAAILMLAVTVLLLELGTHDQVDSLMSGGLESLAQQVEERLLGEFRAMRDQVKVIDGQFAKYIEKDQQCSQLSEGSFRQDVTNLLCDGAGIVTSPEIYQNFSQVAWIDKTGQQVFKVTLFPSSTQRINLKARPYFHEPRYRPDYLWSLPGDTSDKRFFVQSARSLTTAELNTGLSIQSGLTCERKSYITAISGQPLALERPFLPVGFDFAVIEADGEVIYHSDERRALKENLFTEIADPDDVHAAVQARSPLHLVVDPIFWTRKGPFLRWRAALKMKESQCPKPVRVIHPA